MERQAFETLALAELDAVYRYALFLCKDAARAEDLVQDVYVKALRAPTSDDFEPRDVGMRAWLLTIARNTFFRSVERDNLSRRSLRLIATLEHADAPDAAEIDRIDWSSAGPRVSLALGEMSDELAEVLWLWAVHGLKYREIAATLDTPIGTVMSRLHRARTYAARALTEDRFAPIKKIPDPSIRPQATGEARHA